MASLAEFGFTNYNYTYVSDAANNITTLRSRGVKGAKGNPMYVAMPLWKFLDVLSSERNR